ncbi:MAG: EamA family transporter [Gemmatimonadetes bacterium]|nr:EamA family transporter [Gemmatimonadota bacterium]
MRSNSLRADLLLLLTAFIWGFAFVAQRMGMEYVGPYLFNAARFALGCLPLMPFVAQNASGPLLPHLLRAAPGSLLAGLFLFAGSSLQQVGIVYTTAGKAGFITGLYVILVPILGLALGQQSGRNTWLGALVATAGLYLLSVEPPFSIAYGDALVLIGALFWAGHVLIIGRFAQQIDWAALAFLQFLTCSLLSFGVALAVEPVAWQPLVDAAWPVFYGGVLSVGVAYTLQVVAQRQAPASHAAIILSLETVFAALGGWWLLSEAMSLRGLAGCGLMFGGMLVSQLGGRRAD